nr:ATP-binding cassette sub-family A member 13 [Jaculus jaculus]
MGHAGRQFQALFWKNWLCRLRHPVLSLAEFFWPCILFIILTILRFQEPPRHRDSCYLQARDLPNRGFVPFVQGLLCNTGSSCRNVSFENSMDHHFRLSRFQTVADHKKINSLAFLKEIQDLAEEIYETMDKARHLQTLWVKSSEAQGSSYGFGFLTMDLNKTEEVISGLESLHQQRHVWDCLLSLPILHITNASVEDGLYATVHCLQVVLSSLTSLGELDWLPRHQTFLQVSGILNGTVSMLTFLQQRRAAANESDGRLSPQSVVWDPQKVQSDLKAQFGLDDFQMEQILNYSAELKEVFDQWQQSGLLQNVLAGVSHCLGVLTDQFEEGGEPWKVAEALHATLLLLSDSLAAGDPRDNHQSSQLFQHLWKVQTVLQSLRPGPALKGLLRLDAALRNVITQDLRFVHEILTHLKTSANEFIPGGADQWKLEKDVFFGGLKQLWSQNASARCLNGHLSEEAALPPGSSSVWGALCHRASFTSTRVLNELLREVDNAVNILQETIIGCTNGTVSIPEEYLGWQELKTRLSEVSLSCSQLFQGPGAGLSPENSSSSGGCEHQLVSTVTSHILEKVQLSLEQMPYWKVFPEFIRKTCEITRYVNMHGSFQNSLMASSEDSPCYAENLDWKVISENYFVFFNNLMKSPRTSIFRALNFTKYLLVVEKRLHAPEDGESNAFLSFVEFFVNLFLPYTSGLLNVPEFYNRSSVTKDVLSRSILWTNQSLEKDEHDADNWTLSRFGKLVTEAMHTLDSHWMKKDSRIILRFIELVLLEIGPELLELWPYDISKGERAKLEETLSTFLNSSGPENMKIPSENFNFPQFLHSIWSASPAMNMDFVHLSEVIIQNLYNFGFLMQEEVSIALDTIYAIQNTSDLFTSLSEPQKQKVENILTHIYLNIFKDKDSALLLQIYSSFYQSIHKLLSIQRRESLITYLAQVSRQTFDIIKQFNSQNISEAFLFLSEAAGALRGISEDSYCQQLLSVSRFLELRARSLPAAEGQRPGMIHATLAGLRQLLAVDEGFRTALLEYVHRLFGGSAEAPLINECFAWANETISSGTHSGEAGFARTLRWARVFSNRSAGASVVSELSAVHCTLSWLQMWAEIWGFISQIFQFDLNIFTPLHAGLTQLLDELENAVKISKNCQGLFPPHHAARLILHLFKNVTQATGFYNWDDLLEFRDLWVALGEELATVRSLDLDQLEKSVFIIETSLQQLKTFPVNANPTRPFLQSLLDVFIELSKTSNYMGKNVHLVNKFLSNNISDHGTNVESVITELRETISFLHNVSRDRALLSCIDIFQQVTELVLEDGLLDLNTSERTEHILARLNSVFSSENTTSTLKGCDAWVDIMNHLGAMDNSSVSQSHLHSILGNFKDIENKMNSTLKILAWVLTRKTPLCSLNESNRNCVNNVFKDINDFLNIILTTGLEKDKVPKFEILSVLLNNFTQQVSMIINNLTADFGFSSPYNWEHFHELILRPIEIADKIPAEFQNLWLYVIALGKEAQALLRGIFPNIQENNSSSNIEKIFSVFPTSPREKDLSRLSSSVHHLAHYFVFNLSHDLQNSSEVIPRDILKAVSLSIQLVRDAFNSLEPAIRYTIPQNAGDAQVLKKVTSLMHTLRKGDIELLVDQLEQTGESLMDFFKNLSRLRGGNLGDHLLVDLMEKLVDSSHSWDVNHLLRLSRLFPKDVVKTVVDLYYALPHAVGLLREVMDENITEGLRDVYNFTLVHGMRISNTTKEDFAVVIKILLDATELLSDQPAIVLEALKCFPVVWCWNYTTSEFRQNSRATHCNVREFPSSSFYHSVARLLDRVHLPAVAGDSLCSSENLQGELSREVVCVIHEVVDWNSILSELLELFHGKTLLVKTAQEFWHKVLPSELLSRNQSNDDMSELCPGGTIKHVALKIIEALKNVNFTKLLLGESILDTLASFSKIVNITEGLEMFGPNRVSLNLERIVKSISDDWSLKNSINTLLSPLIALLNTNLSSSSFNAVSSLIENSGEVLSSGELWADFKPTVEELAHDFSLRHLISEINRDSEGINSMGLRNMTSQLSNFLEILASSSLKKSEIIKDFLLVMKPWLQEHANEDYFRLIQTLFIAIAHESPTDDVALLMKDIYAYFSYLRNISREGNLDVPFLTYLLNQEQLTNFSVTQFLLESIVINSTNQVAVSPQEAAPTLSDTDLQIRNFINLTLSHLVSFALSYVQPENGGGAVLPPGGLVNVLEQLWRTFASRLLMDSSENRISLLLKDLHRDVTAEMSFVPKDKILEILKLDQFLTWMNEDRLMNIFSSFKESVNYLIKNLFTSGNRELTFDSHQRLAFMQDLFLTLLLEPLKKTENEDNIDFLSVVSQLLLQVNGSKDLFKLNQNLRSVLHLVRESSTEIANLLVTLFDPVNQDFCASSPALHELAEAKLTDLLSFINTSFPLRNSDTLVLTRRVLGAISRASEKSPLLEPVLEVSRTLAMLVNDSADLGDLAASVDSTVSLLQVAKKVSRKMTILFRTFSIYNTMDTMKFFDMLYSVMQQHVRHLVKDVATLKEVDHFIFEKTNNLLMPFLDMVFGVMGLKPNVSQDSDSSSMLSVLSHVNQSEEFTSVLEEVAEFLISGKISLRDLEHLLVVVNNRTQHFSTDSVNLWKDILDCLVPINNMIKQIDFLKPSRTFTHSDPQDTKWKGIHPANLLLDEMLTENQTEIGSCLKMVMNFTSETLWNSTKESTWDILNMLVTLAQDPNNFLKIIGAVGEASGGIRTDCGKDLSKILVLLWSLMEDTETVLSGPGLPRHPGGSLWVNFASALLSPVFKSFLYATTRQDATSVEEERAHEKVDVPHSFRAPSHVKDHLKKLIVLIEHWRKDPLLDQSVAERCHVLRRPQSPSGAAEPLQRAEMLLLRAVVVLAENPTLTKDILCTVLSCNQGGIRHLILSALQGVALVHSHYQEIGRIWSSPDQLDCEHLSRNLSRALESFVSHLENASSQDCTCHPLVVTVQQHMDTLAQSFKDTWMSRNPIMAFFSNFTITEGIKIKDLMKNITKLTEDLQSFLHMSDETIHSILEGNISYSKVLSSALTIALSGECDEEILHLLLTFPGEGNTRLAMQELCGLHGSDVYTLLVVLSQNLDLRTFVYQALIPSEIKDMLDSLLDVISSLSSLLAKAQHVAEYLPEFLHTFKITALLNMPDIQQVSKASHARSPGFGSFQWVMKLICRDHASLPSNSNMFLSLPRVNELLEDDEDKFNIPKDSTPFCLKLYQEILQSPNGALMWSFLKPILHGKILYTPNSPDINEVIQKANHTFYFVDKLKILAETLLKMSTLFQGSGNGQMASKLQEALSNKFIRKFVESHLHIDVNQLTESLQIHGAILDQTLNHVGAGHFRFLASILVNLSSCVVLDRFQAVESVDILENMAHELMQRNSFLASVIFNSSLVRRRIRAASLTLPPHVTYTIRTSVLYSMRTDLIQNPSWKFHPQSLPADGFKYNYVFVPLQDMIERAIIMVQTGRESLEPTTQTQAAPYPCHTSDLFLNNVGFFFPLIMMLTWMVSMASMVRKLVYEREIQIEEYMRMMGVYPATHFLAWFLENMAMLTLSSAALAIILKTSGIFAHSDAFIVFLFFLDFGLSAVMLSYFLSAFFSQANTAALYTSLGYMVSFLPYIVLLVLRSQLGFAIQTLLCFLSTTAFGQGVFFITFLEGQETGIQWNNMYQAPEPGGMTFGWVCWMILFDSSLYFLCGWYFSSLVPGTFGFQKPWYFPFTARYWKSLCGLMEKQRLSLRSGLFFFNEDFSHEGSSQRNTARELEEGPPGVSLLSVTKEYEAHKVAIQDLTLTFHRGQITALLGTNGAGKTTIISMLTGLYPPTSGTILINGKNLQTDLSRVRAELGVCLQQDVLLDHLTIREHLLLFASIKAPWWTKTELQQHVNKTLDEVGLTQHQHKAAQALSGGMKRKLSIGIAFLGTSSTVILDEPTSGVDPSSRRSLWDILLKYREGRTIVFTTHHLDEAEMLSDRVAVLQQGQLRCYAPPSCLTEAHGQGFTLSLAKQNSVLEAHDPKGVAPITFLVQSYIPQASLKNTNGRELTYLIPKDSDKTCFKGLFQALEQNLQQLHLTGYGISDTTLEEVFLMLLQDPKKTSHISPVTKLEPQSEKPVGSSPVPCGSPTPCPSMWTPREPAQGHLLLLTQVTALLKKRLLHTLRDWRNTASALGLPVLFVALAMGLFMVQPLATTYPPLKLTPGHYERAETYFFSSGNDDADLTHILLQKFGDQDPLCAGADPHGKNSSGWHRGLYSHPEFQDSCGCVMCPNRSSSTPYRTNCLGHTLLNLSGFDVEEYLLAPSAKPKLGGWSFGVQAPEEVQDVDTNFSKPRTLAKVWYNQKGFHSLPSYLNHLNNLILWRHLSPLTADWRQYGITLYSHPYGGALLNEDKILESIRQCGVALCIVLGFSILSASIGSSVVRDRVTGAKRLQHLSGLGHRTYWLTNFLYDMLFYLVSVCLCISMIVAFQLSAFTFRENLAATALLLALFGYAVLPWMYLMSRIFPSPDVAFISYISLNFIFGLCTMLMTTMPRLLAIISKAQNLQDIYDVLKWVFTIFPQFCLGQGLIELCYNQIKYDLTYNFGIDSYVSPFTMNFLGWIFVVLALQGTVLLLLRILLHGDLLWWSRGHSALQGTCKSARDIDVEEEQMRVLEGRTSEDIMVLYNLSKSYRGVFKKAVAVRGISLGLRRGECFGLLGVNGAGKSTTFKILAGELPPSSGHVVIRTPQGDAVGLPAAGRAGIRIGYCPQRDALDELLTGWEHLHYYCSLRGIPKHCIPELSADLVRRLHLEAHADKTVATYSGGTKRKLSTALALVGKPDILLLDEPSSGMDPCSKRCLWQTIMQEVRDGCAAVLTSHSMEECEALCTRLAVMVDGSFRCLGPPQHIKSRFGDGYTIKVWLHKEANGPDTISDFLKLHFPGIRFKGQHLNSLEYHVPKHWECLADLFGILENNKSLLRIEHYSISQTTLEQVFINFTTEQQTSYAPLDPSTGHHHPHHIPI